MTWRRSLILLSVSTVIVFLCSIGLFAQGNSAALSGRVTDQNGLAVVGAKITAVNMNTNNTIPAETNEAGLYNFQSLPPGIYRITVEKEGFEMVVKPGLELHVADSVAINFMLQIGSISQSVTVTGEAPVVNTTTSTLGALVNEQQVSDLPLNGRNYIDLTLLQPGIQQSSHGSSAGSSGTWFSSNGTSPRSNSFYLDGASMVNQFGTGSNSIAGTTLGVDGIKEYKVVTSMFGAEYGMTMGSQTIMVSKSGTNNWHGDVFEYLRNNHLDARNFFDPLPSFIPSTYNRLPAFARNNFGASSGGPIQKDKTFFYLVYEGLRVAQGDSIQTVTLPAACHNWVDPSTGTIYNNVVGIQQAKVPGGAVLADLWDTSGGLPGHAKPAGTASACGGVTIPASGVAPTVPAVVQPWIGQYPLPNEGPSISNGNGFTMPGSTRIREDYSQLRVDHNFSANDALFVRATFDDLKMKTPYSASLSTADTGAAFPQFDSAGRSRNQYYTLGENHIFSPKVLNSFRLSFSRTFFFAYFDELNSFLNPNFSLRDSPTCNTATPPNCVWSFNPGQLNGGLQPGSGTTILTAGGVTYPSYHAQNLWTLADDVFYTAGKHALKVGFLLNHYQNSSLVSKGVQGQILFPSVGNFVQGFGTSYTAVLPSSSLLASGAGTLLAPPYNGNYLDRSYFYNTQGFYVQDDWRALQRMTVNLGVRYETSTVPHEMYGRMSTIPDIQTSSNFRIGPLWGNPSLKNFAPRIGFAWDVFGTGKTAVRSGFGIYYDVANFGQVLSNQGPNGTPPFSYQTNYQPPANTVVSIPLSFPASTFGKALQYQDYNSRNPHMLQYNLTIEQQLPFGIGLSVAYVGNRGININTIMEGNPVVPDHYTNGLPIYNTSNAYNAPAPANAGCANNALSIGQPAPTPAPCRVNPYWTSVLFSTTASNSWYSGLQVVVSKRLSHGLEFSGSYTYSKAEDTTTGMAYGNDCIGPGSAIGVSPSNLALDKGVGCSDIPQSMHLSFLYHFPNIRSGSFLSKLTNGWWMGNIATVQQGFPFTPLIQAERSYSGVVVNANTEHASLNTVASTLTTGGKTYNFIPYDPKTVITGNPNQWFNPLMFGEQPLGQYGTAGRNIMRMPGLGEWDLSLAKDTRLGFLGEQGNLQFRAEFFNLINRANFGIPNGNVFAGGAITTPCPNINCTFQAPNGNVGLITTTATTPRQIQLALKVVF